MEKELSDEQALAFLNRFHGHIGPYVVLGYRAGLIANRELGEDPFCKHAHTMTGFKTPVSCFTDGVQLGSCCTLGKGNIEVTDEGQAKVIFEHKKNGGMLTVSLTRAALDRISQVDGWEAGDRLGKEMLSDPDEELFIVELS